MLLTEKIQYKKLERVTTAEGRKYVGDDNVPVPSVTTVLDKTSDKTALIAWRKRVGEAEANRVSRESAGLGTKVHDALEKHILGEQVTFGNNMVSVMAKDMSELVINEGFKNVDEVWGTEIGLIAPGLYAGTTDCIGMHKGEEAIIDFKKQNGKWIGNGNINKSSSETERLYKALVLGLRDYVNNNKFPGVVLGLSGGIDSALVAAIATDAFGSSMVQSIMLPSNFTGQDSLNDAKDTANLLKINFSNLEINEAMKIVDKTLGKFNGKIFSPGITEENIQSRIRGLLLMALSNRYGYMVLATGNKSEYAVGYSTLYGDMCGGFAPIKDVWKTDVFKLCRWINENFSELFKGPKGRVIPENIITKAPTAELRENQKDTDSLPEYEILDEILKGLVEKEISVEKIISKGFEREIVEKTAHLLARSEYKRFQSAPGPKVTSKAFGRDRRFPLTSGFRNWN